MSSSVAASSPKKNWRKPLIIALFGIVLLLSVIIWWRYYKAYSEGERIGKDLKISTRGDVFKTCEGYFTEGCRDLVANPTQFTFSVADEVVEAQLKKLQLEPDACVLVRYRETNSTLPWRGESNYIILEAKRLDP
jgi:hypothetical protein